jgi:hypothetical protein
MTTGCENLRLKGPPHWYTSEKEYQNPYCKANAVTEGEGLKVWLKISIFGSMYSTVQYSTVQYVQYVQWVDPMIGQTLSR